MSEDLCGVFFFAFNKFMSLELSRKYITCYFNFHWDLGTYRGVLQQLWRQY